MREVVLVVKDKIWEYYERRGEIGRLYNRVWGEGSEYGMEYVKDEEVRYYYDVRD